MSEADVFKALSDPVRLQIVESIAKSRGCVQVIGKRVGKAQPNVSQHLRVLRLAGLVKASREGRKICYCLADRRVCELVKLAREVSV